MRWSNKALRGVAVLLLGSLGCGSAASPPETTGDYHASHGISAHRPESFASAVEKLTSRRDALLLNVAPKDLPTALQELKDIVRWLPELAGDSDLRRADWEQVQRLALELQELTDPWLTIEHLTDSQARNHYDKLVVALRPLAEKSVTSPLGQ